LKIKQRESQIFNDMLLQRLPPIPPVNISLKVSLINAYKHARREVEKRKMKGEQPIGKIKSIGRYTV